MCPFVEGGEVLSSNATFFTVIGVERYDLGNGIESLLRHFGHLGFLLLIFVILFKGGFVLEKSFLCVQDRQTDPCLEESCRGGDSKTARHALNLAW